MGRNQTWEAALVARQSRSAQVAALADWWHMSRENEALTNLAENRNRLRHVHVPVPPQPTDAGRPETLRTLTAVNYTCRFSLEDNGKRFDGFSRQAPQALAYLRTHLRR